MAQICSACGNKPLFGNSGSHSNNKTRRRWNINLKSVKAVLDSGGTKKIRVCTRCIRSGRVKKAA